MGRIEAGMVVGGVQIGVEILGGRVALSVSGELLEAGADVAVVIDRDDRLTVVEDAGEVTRLRHMRREGQATLPAGDVTLDSGPAEAVELAESGEYLLADAVVTDPCDRCGAPAPGDRWHDYCAGCGQDLCPSCMGAGCCDVVPGRSGNADADAQYGTGGELAA